MSTLEGARDEWDRKAHDILCIIKYGSPGGGIRNEEMYRVSDILRGHPFKPAAPVLAPIPTIKITPPVPIPVMSLPPVPVLKP